MTPEYRKKCSALIDKLGRENLRPLLPSIATVRAALAAGDEHLNTINLVVWDRAAGVGSQMGSSKPCPTCGQRWFSPSNDWPHGDLRTTAKRPPWNAAPTLSLSERVCVLKELARQLAEGVPK